MSNMDYDRLLKKEIWGLHKHLRFSMEDIYKMTVYERREYIKLHNEEQEKIKNEIEEKRKK